MDCSIKKEYDWMIGPFKKENDVNPCMGPKEGTSFFCPVWGKNINWENKDVFNPTAIVRDGKLYLFYRAEDTLGKYSGTSRVGLAVSDDGLHFSTEEKPVIYPDKDEYLELEWEGGCEDPRIVEREDGKYILLYTAFDGKTAILCSAVSDDLRNWKKCGPVFAKAYGGKYAKLWSKSGAVVCALKDDGRFIAERVNGKYWMYWGESNIYAAVSDDLISWEPVEFLADGTDTPVLYPVIIPRKGDYDEFLCEPGPQAVLTEKGIVLLYNGKGKNFQLVNGYDTIYKAGQILLDKNNPLCLLARTTKPFIEPTEEYEFEGQVMPTCFIEGMAVFNGKYYLYYGTADSHIAVATAKL